MTAPLALVAADTVIKSSLILGATSLAALALRRASASTRHLLWTLGLASALAVPALSAAVPRWQLPIVTLQSAAPAPMASASVTQPAAASDPIDVRAAAPRARRSDAAPAVAQQPAPRWSIAQIALFIWIAGAFFIAARLLFGLALVRLMTRRTREVTNATWLPQAHGIVEILGLRRVRFVRARAASMPMACGLFRPVVLMPADAEGWPDARLRIVLLHELAHVKRRDCLTHAIAQMTCAAYWFNPLVWIAAKRLRVERERACDDLVLRAGTRGSEYADQLLAIARVMHGGRFAGLLGGATLAMAHRSQLEGRLMAILDPTVPRRALSRVRIATAVIAAFAIVLALASVQPWAQARSDDRPLKSEPLDVVLPAPQAQSSASGQADQGPTAQRDRHDRPVNAGDLRDQIRESVRDALRNNGALDPKDAQELADSIRDTVRQGIGVGVGTGVGLGVDIASSVVDTVMQTVTGLTTGITRGVTDGIAGGVSGGIVGGVTGGVVNDVVTAVTAAVNEAADDIARDTAAERARHRGVTVHDSRTLWPLVSALDDSSRSVRREAARTLGEMGDRRAVWPLVSALGDSDAGVRAAAASSLGEIGDIRARGSLIAALKDPNAAVRHNAASALGEINHRKAGR